MYFPQPLQDDDDDDGFYPSEHLRQLELHANEVFDIYRELYFGKSTSVSSVYLWDKEPKNYNNNKNGGTNDKTTGFCGAFLIQNKVDDGSYWNSIHVVDVGGIERGSRCEYKLTTTILISVTPSEEKKDVESTTISGSLIRQNSRKCNISSSSDSSSSSIRSEHIVNIGKFIEDVETEMRKEMDALYIQKTKNVVDMVRKDAMKPTQGQEHTRVLNEAVLAMAMNRKTKLGGK